MSRMATHLPAHRPSTHAGPLAHAEVVSIDCHSCLAPRTACSDCVVAMLLPDDSAGQTSLSLEEHRALTVLSDSGLVPPLRFAASSSHPSPGVRPSEASTPG